MDSLSADDEDVVEDDALADGPELDSGGPIITMKEF